MAWIESHQSLSRHRKTLRAAALLRCDRHKLIGHLHELWWWGLDNVPSDGALNGTLDEEIEGGAEWDGEPGAFVAALIGAAFIDVTPEGRYLHDWFAFAGKFLARREDNARRQRDKRARDAAVTSQTTDPVRNANVTRDSLVTSRGSHGATVPNPTVPTHSPTENEAPAAPDAPPAPSEKKPRKRDVVFEAIQAVWPQGPRTEVERGKWNKAAKELRDGGVTPEQILTAARHWPNVMGAATMTPMALAANLGMLLDGPQVNGRSNGTTLAAKPVPPPKVEGPAPLEFTPEQAAASDAELERIREQMKQRGLAGRAARIGGA